MGLAILEIATILGLAGLYAVAATGYTLIHGVTRQFHLALGAFYMAGAFVALVATMALDILGLPYGALLIAGAMLGGFVAPAAGGALSWRLTLPAPTARYNPTAPLVTTIGLWIVLTEAARLIQGPRARFVDPPVDGTIALYTGGDFAAIISTGHALVVPLAFGTVAAIGLLVARTGFGRAYRATADDPGMAELMGIRVSTVVAWVYAIGCGLAGLAGVFATIRYGAVWHYMGFLFGLKALTAAVIGGIGSVRGAVIGALVVATVEVVWAVHVSGAYRDVVVFALLVAALVFRPEGLIERGMAEATPGAGGARR